ncbi:MAG: hypothetical protein HYR96_13000 [Deltaproteobacteria bacterium]|nr:hypothetical protein [Deltaproteobacteria bacterium]MBI3295815.1 hypothetical protein [Deltaproteobacteria bacterium]
MKWLMCVLVGSVVWAEAPVSSSGVWKMRRDLAHTKGVEEFRGNIISSGPSPEQDEPGFHLKLNTRGGEILVHVGPRWVIDEHNFDLTHGQPVVIYGAAISLGERHEVLATEIRQGEHSADLREPRPGGRFKSD